MHRTDRGGEMVLLVRRDSGITSAAHLKNRKVLVQSGHRGNIAVMWMDILLMRKGQPLAEHFCSIKRVNKATQAVLPVFFGQADAAVINRDAFETVAELNPQIMKEVAEIVSSKAVVHSVSCFRKNTDSDIRKAVLNAAMSLDKDSYGRQVLTLFQLNRVAVYEPKYLEYLSSLVNDHSEMKKRFAGKR
jgi:phosphonate transport system substrate-binding protein